MAQTVSLLDSARMLVRRSAWVREGETVCIAADTNTRAIAEAIMDAAREAGAEPVLAVMSPRRAHGNEPPSPIAGAMRHADVVFQPVTYAMTHTDATREAMRAGARVLVLRGITEDIMTGGAMLADYEEVERLTKRVAELLTGAKEIHVRTPAGTDLRLAAEGRTSLALTGRIEGPGTFVAMPDGEAAIAPVEGTARGTLVIEHAMDSIGTLDGPIRITVEGGRAVDIQGGASAAELRSLVDGADEEARNIAEFAIGTNESARMIGSMTEDKKKKGTVHVAVGDNHVIGGTVESQLHLDGLLLRPTVELDGRTVVSDGRIAEDLER